MVLSVEDYVQTDATALAQMVKEHEVSAAELLEVAIAQLQRLNPLLDAVNVPMLDEARERVQKPLNGALAGVPVLIKDANQDYAGLPTSYGSRGFCKIIPKQHSVVVQRLLDAGAVIFGKTNTPELGLKGVTDPVAFGVTKNPWDLSRSPGGSSGGSAAAVASVIAPIAGANDGGGSIRIPASYCGLFGLRPSRGRVPPGPAGGEIWEGASSDHVLSRSVRDSALALDVLAGPYQGDPFVIAPPERSFVSSMIRDPGRLKIAFSTRSPIGTDVAPEAVEAVQNTAKLLGLLGHDVGEDQPQYDGAALARCYLEMYFGQVAATLGEVRAAGAKSADFELTTLLLEGLGKATGAGDYIRSHRRWNEFSRSLGKFHQRHDLFLTPTVATPPVSHEATLMPAGQAGSVYALEYELARHHGSARPDGGGDCRALPSEPRLCAVHAARKFDGNAGDERPSSLDYRRITGRRAIYRQIRRRNAIAATREPARTGSALEAPPAIPGISKTNLSGIGGRAAVCDCAS
jgi:amidase